MCRLLGIASSSPVTAVDVLGQAATEHYIALSKLHRDGWGTAWLPESEATLEFVRGQGPGWEDPRLWEALHRTPASARIVHERLAKVAPRWVRPGNVHPFVDAGIAFAHNGTLGNHRVLTARTPLLQRFKLRGGTDSEIYFRMVVDELRQGATVSESALTVARTLRHRLPHSSLNALILSSDALVAVHASATTPIPTNTLLRRNFVGDPLPREHDKNYYQMRIRELSGSVVVASTGFDQTGWADLPPESVTTISLENLSVRTRLLAN